ncbi:SecD/SecF fusion protein [Breznakibacter xylanolyticus]|uniref:Multifunctional fusion protein n=1 Tax=Breznakibacter xylanolyticus TaxID=990 RepID=A0A2W7NM80_9BACT|nr:protein translocase subunit SecDF [Breznakibacter xylanolyticus]PZX20663.1 SecD/SecF fusion protein [Breznakibacter xylanolyticus]
MQNKGAIRLFAILLAVVSLYQLLFTVATKRVESKALAYAQVAASGNSAMVPVKEAEYLDSVSGETALNLLVLKYTYKQCKEKEINFGLDLKGGMNLILEVKVSDIVKALANYNPDATFNTALRNAEIREKNSTSDFLTLFGEEFEKADPNAKLAAIFTTLDLKEKVNLGMSNAQVLSVLKEEAQSAIDNSFNILRTRIDRFGVTQPNIQKLEKAGRVLVELPGIKEPERVRKLLQGTASLEFWETYDNTEIYQYLMQADAFTREVASAAAPKDSTVAAKDSISADFSDFLAKDKADSTAQAGVKSLYSYLMPSQQGGPVVGMAIARDTSKVNAMLALVNGKDMLPRDLRLMWTVKPIQLDAKAKAKADESIFQLVAIKSVASDGRPPLEGDVITNARAESRQQGGFEVSMAMNASGAKTWARLTRANIGKSIAIVLDGYVYSFPTVNDEISGGRSSITGNFTVDEAQDLANILKSGKLPAPARIVEDTVVGPSLGKQAVNSGLMSFLGAFILVLLYMIFYYRRAGLVANVALIANVFFLIGVLASFGAVLTLPGLAGITLTLGMAVDANVIIYERIREELRAGKGVQLAVADGYKNAYSAILDGNVTTLLTAIILFVFGTGPIQGFATTLMIGIFTSLFTAIFISRIIFERMLDKNQEISFSSKTTANVLVNANFDFIGMRKKLYMLSGAVILVGIISIAVQGFNYGVDFSGGRNYVLRFNESVNTVDLQSKLTTQFDNQNVEVKVFGADNQVKVTTKYLIDADETTMNTDSIISHKLYAGSQDLLHGASYSDFNTNVLQSSQKVGPSISFDIKLQALWAVLFSLIGIFLYIFIRFKDWRFGLGGLVSLAHDTLFVLGIFSLLKNLMPFSMDLDSAFIAAILTVIGYSINDTVIVYDRIREYREIHPKWDLKALFNGAINSTLGRTMNTSLTTLFVLVVIFIFGGESIRGFVFALLIGIAVGTYSSIFIAAPIVYDAIMGRKNKQ